MISISSRDTPPYQAINQAGFGQQFKAGNACIGATDPGAYKLTVNGEANLGGGVDGDLVYLAGNGYQGFITMDTTGLRIKQNSGIRDIEIVSKTCATLN